MMRNSVANRNTHEALLATATSLFNQRGFSATRLVDVADRIGVTQNALYHYVSGKRDLAYQCYLTGCRSRERLLIAAGKRPGLAAIRLFVDKSLSEEEGEMAVMGEVALLTNEQARKVNRETKRSLGALAKMIEAGVSDGSIRKCDPLVAAYSIVSMLDWVPVWFSEKSGDRTALRRTFVDIVTAGVGLKSNSLDDLLDIPFTPALPAAETQVFDRDELGIIKREQILRTTMKMVNRQGVGGVTVDGVAAQLGLSKGAIYYYFRHKNDLIYETFARAHRLGLHCRALRDGTNYGSANEILFVPVPVSTRARHRRRPDPRARPHNIATKTCPPADRTIVQYRSNVCRQLFGCRDCSEVHEAHRYRVCASRNVGYDKLVCEVVCA